VIAFLRTLSDNPLPLPKVAEGQPAAPESKQPAEGKQPAESQQPAGGQQAPASQAK
jgi:cytochrome c